MQTWSVETGSTPTCPQIPRDPHIGVVVGPPSNACSCTRGEYGERPGLVWASSSYDARRTHPVP
jgi:hypothetical protein